MAQLSMRIDDELRDKFAKLAEENGMSQPQMFAQLMAQAETDELKAMVPEIATEIDAVRTHLNSVMDAYTMAVKRSTEAYEIAADKVRGQLEAMGTLTSENKRLSEENRQLAADVEAAKAETGRLEQELAEAQKKAAEALAEAQARDAEADDLKRQLTEAREQILSLREQHAAELEKAKSESAKQIAEAREQLLKLREQHAEEMAEERKAHAAALEKVRAEGFAQIIEYVKAQQSKPSGASK